MSLADDLLELARKMVKYEKKDVLEARLRRAVSTAYYALFHLLLEKGSAKLVGHAGLRQLVSRAYLHGDMYKAAKTFVAGIGGLPKHVIAPFGGMVPPVPPEIIRVATAFVALQEARHEADYDLAKLIARDDARRLVSQADQAFTDWNVASADATNADMCELFLASLLLCERWKK
jgi:uncharacterized protein (UPF0332 family)